MGGVDPTVHTYKAVMRACASAEQSRHVMQLLRQMERNNLTPTAVHYGIAVDACGRSGELKRMMNLLSEAQVTGCPTATATYTITTTTIATSDPTSPLCRRGSLTSTRRRTPQRCTRAPPTASSTARSASSSGCSNWT